MPDQRGRQSELLVLLLADVAGAIVHGDADATASVWLAPPPCQRLPTQTRTLPFSISAGNGGVVLERVGGFVVQMAPGHQASGAVLLGEVGDGPHGVADDGDVRSGQRDQLVVGVEWLRVFVGADGDGGERRNEESRIEHPLDYREDVGVDRDLVEERPVRQQVVDPSGAHPFEQVGGGNDVGHARA